MTHQGETEQKIDDKALQDALQRAYERAIARRPSSIVFAHFDLIEEWRQKGLTFDEISLALAEIGVSIKPMTLRVLFSKERSKRKKEKSAKLERLLPLMEKIATEYPPVEREYPELKEYRIASLESGQQVDVMTDPNKLKLNEYDLWTFMTIRYAYLYLRHWLLTKKWKILKEKYSDNPALSEEEMKRLIAEHLD